MERFRNVLLWVDGVKTATAFERAVALCRRTGAKLGMLAVTPELSVYLRYPPASYPSLEDTLREEAEDELAVWAAKARGRNVEVVTHVRHGKPFLEITREAIEQGHDLVIVPVCGKGARAGSTVMRLFQTCPAPVWAVRKADAGPYRRVLAAVDPSGVDPAEAGLNERILDLALRLAELERARLDVLHAWTVAPVAGRVGAKLRSWARNTASQALAELIDPIGLPDDSLHLVEGEPSDVIAAFVEGHEVDMLVMGTVVRTGLAGIVIGNTAEHVLSRVDCSVLALKPAGFRSPVEAE